MRQAYGLTDVKFVPYAIGDQYAALDRHRAETIAIFTTTTPAAVAHQFLTSSVFRWDLSAGRP
jgi:hypothetical protein